MRIDDADILMDAEKRMQKNGCRKIKRTVLASSEDEERQSLNPRLTQCFQSSAPCKHLVKHAIQVDEMQISRFEYRAILEISE